MLLGSMDCWSRSVDAAEAIIIIIIIIIMLRARTRSVSGEINICSPLTPLSITPAHRSAPAPLPLTPRFTSTPLYFAMPAHHSPYTHTIFGLLCSDFCSTQ